jgi:sugar-specific transcriptional regulator TrmB
MAGEETENIDPVFNKLRHDINNQLSNIQLCLEELKYEVTEPTEDYRFYLETITGACKKIGELLQNPQ